MRTYCVPYCITHCITYRITYKPRTELERAHAEERRASEEQHGLLKGKYGRAVEAATDREVLSRL